MVCVMTNAIMLTNIWFCRPVVVVLTNVFPNYDLMSGDRWATFDSASPHPRAPALTANLRTKILDSEGLTQAEY